MTLGEVKQALKPKTSFKVDSSYIVDLDAIAVQQGDKTLFYILHPSDTQLAYADKFEFLVTDNPQFQTAEDLGPGMPLSGI